MTFNGTYMLNKNLTVSSSKVIMVPFEKRSVEKLLQHYEHWSSEYNDTVVKTGTFPPLCVRLLIN